MKKYSILVIALVINTILISSCNNADNSKVESNEAEQSEQTELDQPKSVETTTVEVEINQVEADAKRMAQLSCEAQKNISEGQKSGVPKEEINSQNDPLNAEMTEISKRFEEEYENNEKKDEFQRILQEELKKCNN